MNLEALRDLLRFDGRLSRISYWRAYLRLSIAGAVTLLVGFSAIIAVGSVGAILLLPTLPIAWATLGIATRRLHDRGKSIWWLGPFIAAPLLIPSAVESADVRSPVILLLAAVASLVLGVWGLIEIGFRRGVPGPNDYGEDPQPS